MDILIVLISLLFGAFISYFILNKKLTASNQKNIQLETTLNEKEKNFLEKFLPPSSCKNHS